MTELQIKSLEPMPQFSRDTTSPNDGFTQTSAISKVLALAIAFYIGTGGFIPSRATSAALNSFTTAAFTVKKSEYEDTGESWFAASLKEKLSLIRHFLSASMTELARMLLVQRPTVYSWLSDSSFPQVANVERVSQLFNTVASLRKTVGQPVGTYLKEPLSQNKSLLDVLTAAEIDDRTLQALFVEIKRALDRADNEKASSYTSVRDAAAELGYAPAPEKSDAYMDTFLPH